MNKKIINIILMAVVCFFAWLFSGLFFYGERAITKIEFFDIVFIVLFIAGVIFILTRKHSKIDAKVVQKYLAKCNISVPLQEEYKNKLNEKNIKIIQPLVNTSATKTNSKVYTNKIMFFIVNYQNELLYKITSKSDVANQCFVYDPYDNSLGKMVVNYGGTLKRKYNCLVEIFNKTSFKIELELSLKSHISLMKDIFSKGTIDIGTEDTDSFFRIEGIPLIYKFKKDINLNDMTEQILSLDKEVLAECKISSDSSGLLKNRIYEMELKKLNNQLEVFLTFISLRVIGEYTKATSNEVRPTD